MVRQSWLAAITIHFKKNNIMATNLDKSENTLTEVQSVSFVRGIDGIGNSVRISAANLASVLGVVKWKGSVTGVNTPVNTGISVNAGNGGETLLALCSGHSGAGNLTTSAIYMLRFGYNGGNLSVIQIARLSGASDAAEFTFAVSDNTLTVAGPHGSNYIKLISNKV